MEPKTPECKGLDAKLYLLVMLGVIGVITAVSVPSLFSKRCSQCGSRNWLEASVCKKCGVAFPKES